MAIQAALIKATFTESNPSTSASNKPDGNTSSAPLWWLLVHIKMLILASKTPDDDADNVFINIHIATHLKLFHIGQIKALWDEAMYVTSRRNLTDRSPTCRTDDKAAQHTADHDN